jgi:hypothetical protein
LEGSGRGLNRGSISKFCLEKTGGPAEIRTDHIPNRSLEPYRYANPLGVKCYLPFNLQVNSSWLCAPRVKVQNTEVTLSL